jgi:hypothetical protein
MAIVFFYPNEPDYLLNKMAEITDKIGTVNSFFSKGTEIKHFFMA